MLLNQETQVHIIIVAELIEAVMEAVAGLVVQANVLAHLVIAQEIVHQVMEGLQVLVEVILPMVGLHHRPAEAVEVMVDHHLLPAEAVEVMEDHRLLLPAEVVL